MKFLALLVAWYRRSNCIEEMWHWYRKDEAKDVDLVHNLIFINHLSARIEALRG